MEEKGFSRLIENYYLSVALFLFFFFLVLQVPLLYFNVYPNFQLKLLSLRCFVLNGLSSLLFLFLREGYFKELLTFSVLGLILSLLYLKLGKFLLLPFCLSATATTVIMVSLLAYLTIAVRFGE